MHIYTSKHTTSGGTEEVRIQKYGLPYWPHTQHDGMSADEAVKQTKIPLTLFGC